MYSYPPTLVEVYYERYGSTLPDGKELADDSGAPLSLPAFKLHMDKMDSDDIEAMADKLYDEHYSKFMLPDVFDYRTGLQKWRDDQPSWVKNVADRMADRMGDVAGGVLDSVHLAAEWLEKKIPLGGFNFDDMEFKTAEEWQKDEGKDWLRKIGDKATDWNPGTSEWQYTSWEDVKRQPQLFLRYALETGLVSAPEMVLAANKITFVPWMMGLTGDMAKKRAANDGLENATLDQWFAALGPAAFTAMMERIGARGVFGMTDALKQRTLKEYGKAVGRAGLREGLTEAAQEPAQLAGEKAWTKAWEGRSAEEVALEIADTSAAGFVAGGPFGGAVRAGTAGVEVAMGRGGRGGRVVKDQGQGTKWADKRFKEIEKALGGAVKELREKLKGQKAEQAADDARGSGVQDPKAEAAEQAVRDADAAQGSGVQDPAVAAAEQAEQQADAMQGAGMPAPGPRPEPVPDVDAAAAGAVAPERKGLADLPVPPEGVPDADAAATGDVVPEQQGRAGLPPAPEGVPETDAGPQPTGTEGEPVAPIPDAERSVGSLTLEAEANAGKRRKLDPAALQPGDKVTVDPDGRSAPVPGTVDRADERLVRIVDEKGAPLAVVRPDRPRPQDPTLYSRAQDALNDAEKEAEAEKAKQDAFNLEMGRLIERVIRNPADAGADAALRRARNSQDFQNLPVEGRNKVDDFLAERDAILAEREAKDADAAKKADVKPERQGRPAPKEAPGAAAEKAAQNADAARGSGMPAPGPTPEPVPDTDAGPQPTGAEGEPVAPVVEAPGAAAEQAAQDMDAAQGRGIPTPPAMPEGVPDTDAAAQGDVQPEGEGRPAPVDKAEWEKARAILDEMQSDGGLSPEKGQGLELIIAGRHVRHALPLKKKDKIDRKAAETAAQLLDDALGSGMSPELVAATEKAKQHIDKALGRPAPEPSPEEVAAQAVDDAQGSGTQEPLIAATQRKISGGKWGAAFTVKVPFSPDKMGDYGQSKIPPGPLRDWIDSFRGRTAQLTTIPPGPLRGSLKGRTAQLTTLGGKQWDVTLGEIASITVLPNNNVEIRTALERVNRQPPAPKAEEKPTEPPPEAEAPPVEAERGRVQEGSEREVITPRGTTAKVVMEIVEGSDLITSHNDTMHVNPDYPQAIQPRDRGNRAASAAQIAKIAGSIDPEQLMPGRLATDGAPIIGPDNAVESGNGRTIALLRAYRKGKADHYRKALEDKGYDVSGMEMPVLVQRRISSMTAKEREQWAAEANDRSTAGRSATETAASDAKFMTVDTLKLFKGGPLTLTTNAKFVQKFVETAVSETERTSMMNAKGELAQEGVTRIQNAMFMAAYGNPEILARLREDTDNNFQAIGGAMLDVAPAWAQMRARAKAGEIEPDTDVTAHLLEALRTVRLARDRVQPLSDIVDQIDAFSSETIHPRSRAMLGLMYADPGSWIKHLGRQRVAKGLRHYAENAMETAPGADIFGDKADIDLLISRSRLAAIEGLKKNAQGDIMGARAEEPGNVWNLSEDEQLMFVLPEPVAAHGDPASSVSQSKKDGPRSFRGFGKTDVVAIEQVRVGLTHVRTPEEAAHVVAPFRKEAQETALAIVLDKNDKLLGVLRHAIGGVSSVNLDSRVLFGAIAQIKDSHSFYFAHNHPSSQIEFSDADDRLAIGLERVTRGTDLHYKGSVLATPARMAVSFRPPRGSNRLIDIQAMPRKHTVPVFGRRWRKIVPVKDRVMIRNPNDLDGVLQRYLPERSGVVLFDSVGRLTGVLALSTSEMAALRGKGGAARDIWRGIAETNATAALVMARWGDRDSYSQPEEALTNMRKFFRAINVQVLAAYEYASDGTALQEHSTHGLSRGTFFSKLKARRVMKDHGAAIRQDIRDIAARIVPFVDHIGFRNTIRMEDPATGERGEAGGFYRSRDRQTPEGPAEVHLIALALDWDPVRTLHHEAIHALRNVGMFTHGEWETLMTAADREGWLGKHQIKQYYPELYRNGKPTEAAYEEAVAEQFADYATKRSSARARHPMHRLFQRIAQFFMELGRRLRLYGAEPTADTIFEAIRRDDPRSDEDLRKDATDIFENIKTGDQARRPEGEFAKKHDAEYSAWRSEFETRLGQRYSKKRPAPGEKLTFTNPETEKRWQEAAKGVKPDTIGRVKEAIGEEWNRLTRYREHLPNTAKFSDAREKLLYLEQAPHAAKERIDGVFKKVMGGLQPDDIDLMTRKMVLDDLLWTSEQEMELPFGLTTTDDVIDELNKVDAVLDGRPDLKERLGERNDAREKLTKLLKATGVLTEEQTRNPDYFRHQVLEYAALRSGRGGQKVRSTYWHARRGSEKDINANFFQAEADWMFKAYQDVGTARLLNWMRGSKYNTKASLVRQAKADNEKVFNQRLADADERWLASDEYKKALKEAAAAQAKADAMKAQAVAAKAAWREEGANARNVEKEARKAKRVAARKADDAVAQMRANETAFALKVAREKRDEARATATAAAAAARAEKKTAKKALPSSDSPLRQDWKKKKQNIGIAMSSLRKAVNRFEMEGQAYGMRPLAELLPHGLRPTLRSFMSGYGKQAAARDDSGTAPIFDLFKALTEIEDLNRPANIVLGAVANRRAFYRNVVGDDYIDPDKTQGLIDLYAPDAGVRVWQPDSAEGERKVHIFTGKTVAQHVIDRAGDKIDDIVGTKLDKATARELKDILSRSQDTRMIGGPMEEMVLPNELADTLDNFHDAEVGGMLDELAIEVNGRWKQWTLFNPTRFAKYYLNNMTGDIDALISEPKGSQIMKKIKPAWVEMREFIKTGEPSEGIQEALDRGVIQSSLTMQEITMRGALGQNSFRPEPTNRVLKYGSKYFEYVQNLARLRESAFRYAAWLHYAEEFAAGKTLEEIGHGASPPHMIRGITDPMDAAARMARDVLGDYGAIPHRARWARQRVMPFVSWIASNTIRYHHRFKNVYLTARDVGAKEGAIKGTAVAAGLAARIFAFYGGVQVWNMLFGDEDDLSSEEKMRLHVHLGRWGGEVAMLRFQGALSDYLAWFGFEDAGAVLMEVMRGRASFGDVIGAVAKAPANKIAGAVTPAIKLPLELGTGQSFWPDYFNPREIRDPWRHLSRTFSMEFPTVQTLKALGEPAPSRPFGVKSVAGALVTFREPGRLAYDTIRGKAFEFLRREYDVRGGGGGGTPRGRLLYNYRRARKLGDETSQRLAIDQLREMRGPPLRESIKRARPLGMFQNARQRAHFLQTLSPRERDQLRRAQLWYRSTNARP